LCGAGDPRYKGREYGQPTKGDELSEQEFLHAEMIFLEATG